jgi:hypothetical protein
VHAGACIAEGGLAGGERSLRRQPLAGQQCEEIRERYHISNWVDDVDNNLNVPIKIAHFIDDKIGPVLLVQYFHYANSTCNWIEVIIDANQNVELAVSRLITTLSLQEGDILGILRSSDFIDLQQ